MNIRRFTTFAFVLAIAALIVGFSTHAQMTPQMEGLRGEIVIGAVHPLTGRLGRDNPPLGQGFELAVTEINNSQLSDVNIKLIVEDGQSTVEGALEAFNKLIHQDGVSAILGPATSMQAQAVFPITQQKTGCGDKSYFRRPQSERDWRFYLSHRPHHRCTDSKWR